MTLSDLQNLVQLLHQKKSQALLAGNTELYKEISTYLLREATTHNIVEFKLYLESLEGLEKPDES